MADAVKGGSVTSSVTADPEATIDGAQPRAEITDARAAVETPHATDYPALQEVERRHYAVVGEIAKGGIGRVLEARDLRLGRQVAIKELLPKNRDAARRFEREARITARLQHPAIIHVYEAGTWPGGEPFYAMQMVHGRSLDKVVAEKKTLVERLALVPNVIAVADALAYAHSEHIIHRDLKPANVLVGEFGQTVVIDWGIAKDLKGETTDAKASMAMRLRASSDETAGGSVVGTPAYMPPEQARGEYVDQRADVYAIGALLYKVLTGEPPYAAASSKEIIELVKQAPPVPLDLREPGAPPELVAIVAKAMARDPADRYATAGELAKDLERFQTGQLVAAHRYTTAQLIWRFLRRYRLALSVGVVALAALAVLAVVSVRRVLAEKERTEAKRLALLEERGRTELLEDRAGPALVYLADAARDREPGPALAFLLADAMRPFQAELASLAAGRGAVVVAASRDGRRIAIGGDQLLVLDARSQTSVSEVAGYGAIRALAFDPAGRVLAVGTEQGVGLLWQSDQRRVVELRGHRGAILDVAFSSDGTRVVTAGADGTARAWQATSGKLIATSHCHDAAVTSARFNPAGTRIATASEDHGACVWSVDSDVQVAPLHGHTGPVRSVRWTGDGKYVLTASDDGAAYLFDAELGKPVLQPMKHAKAVVAAELLPDGEHVVTASADHAATVWDLPDSLASPSEGVPAATPVLRFAQHTDAIVAIAIGADGKQIATASLDGVAKVWDAATGQVIASYEHANGVRSLAFAGDQRLVTGDRDGSAHVWDLTRSVALERHDVKSRVNALAATSSVVVAGSEDSKVTVWHGGKQRALREHLGSVLAVGVDDDVLISAGEDARAIVWNLESGEPRCRFGAHDGPTRALAATHGIAALALPDAVEVWSTRDCRLLGRLDDAAAELSALALSTDGTLVVAAGEDGRVLAWRSTWGMWLSGSARPIEGKLEPRAIAALALSPDGREVLVGGNGAAKVLDVETGRELGALGGPFGKVTAVTWLDGARVVTANSEGVASIWDTRKGKLLGRRGAQGIGASALAVAGPTLWIGSDDGNVRAWNVRVAEPSDELAKQLDKTGLALGDDDVAVRKGGHEWHR